MSNFSSPNASSSNPSPIQTKKDCKTLAKIKLDLGFPVGIELGSFGILDEQFPEK